MSIYADLIEFKRGILARVARDVANLPPPARKAAVEDVAIIEAQMLGYHKRLAISGTHESGSFMVSGLIPMAGCCDTRATRSR